MNLANNIKSVARDHGMTITQLAEQMGVLQPQLSRTINSPRISLEDLCRLADAIGCSVQDFFADANPSSAITNGESVIRYEQGGQKMKISVKVEPDAD